MVTRNVCNSFTSIGLITHYYNTITYNNRIWKVPAKEPQDLWAEARRSYDVARYYCIEINGNPPPPESSFAGIVLKASLSLSSETPSRL